MARQGRLIFACVALIALAACGKQSDENTAPAPKPSGPAAAVQTNSYQGVGIVRGLNPKRPGIEIEHEDIVGLMPAMQMEFPVADAAMLKGLAVNDHIEFTIENAAGDMRVTAIKKK
jgi:Cu/Ag efflux protein CusF